MACEVNISLGARSYPIWVGARVLDRLPAALRGLRGLVVTDACVDGFHGARVMSLLGAGWGKIVLPAGEATKSAGRWADLLEQIAAVRLDRQGVLVALGGGVVGDLAGFAAATYMRGIRFVQVPTSLLAMVDSSVGGKTGINLAAGKNLAGAFHQPLAVFADTDTLATLPAREFAAGMAEVVKYGVALDAEFFTWLERNAAAIHAREPAALERVVARCCEIKADVVSRDERGFAAADAERTVALLKRFGLPVAPAPGLSWGAVRTAMDADKKASGGQVRFVLSGRLGESDLPAAVPEPELRAAWERWCAHVVGE